MVPNNLMIAYRSEPLNNKAQIREFFYQDRPLCAYALGDLEEDNWKISTFTGAFDGDTLAGVALIWRGSSIPVYIAVGEAMAVQTLLQTADLPDTVFYMIPANLRDVLHNNLQVQDERKLWRMVVRPNEFIGGPSHPGLRRLTYKDADVVNSLLEEDPLRPRSVAPETLDKGAFFGIQNIDGEILALAGTHIYAESEGVGVVGYVYTSPNARGRGYATIATGAVTRELMRRGIDHVVLNVEQANPAALRSYQKLGFRIHAPILDGVATKK